MYWKDQINLSYKKVWQFENYPFIHTCCTVRNSKYQPFLQMSELPVIQSYGMVGSSTA